MMFDGSELCWIPTIPISKSQKQRLKIAQFGDGYEQRTLDGINSLETKWSLTFEMREAAVANAMLDFFAGLEGHAFEFLDPTDGVTYRVFCDDWSVNWPYRQRQPGGIQNYVYYGTVTAEFRTANGAAI